LKRSSRWLFTPGFCDELRERKGIFWEIPGEHDRRGKIEAYKAWRVNEHEVRDITLRHDLHAVSKFFGYAIKQHWCRENLV